MNDQSQAAKKPGEIATAMSRLDGLITSIETLTTQLGDVLIPILDHKDKPPTLSSDKSAEALDLTATPFANFVHKLCDRLNVAGNKMNDLKDRCQL